MIKTVSLIAIPEVPLIKEGDDLGRIICDCCRRSSIVIDDNDVFVVAQKVVSKAEGSVVDLSEIQPSAYALELATQTGRNPRLCQVYIDEAEKVLFVKGGRVITKHRLGFECSSAGVDKSNVTPRHGEIVVLLPRDPDVSAQKIRTTVWKIMRKQVAVIINDSFGRHDRDGSVGTAIGIAGIAYLETREQYDLFGNVSRARIGLVDELAAAASILMGQANEGFPVILIHGVTYKVDEKARIKNLLIS